MSMVDVPNDRTSYHWKIGIGQVKLPARVEELFAYGSARTETGITPGMELEGADKRDFTETVRISDSAIGALLAE